MNTLQFKEYLKSITAIEENLRYIPKQLLTDCVIKAWELGGLLSPSLNPDGTIKRMWTNVPAHQCAVARVGYNLARALRLSTNSVTSACLIHDSFKRKEQDIRDEAIKKDADINEAHGLSECLSELFLSKIGFSEDIVNLAGNTGDRGLDLIRSQKASLSSKVIFYSDCVVSNYDIVGYKKRFDDLIPELKPRGRYEGLDRAHIKQYGKTHRQVWDEVVLPLEIELCSLTGFDGNPNDLAIFIIEKRYESE